MRTLGLWRGLWICEIQIFLICLLGLSVWQIQARSALWSWSPFESTHTTVLTLSNCWPVDQIQQDTFKKKNHLFVQIFTAAPFTDRCVWQSDGVTKQKTDSTLECDRQTKTLLRGWPMSATLFNITDFGNCEHNNTCFPVGYDQWKWFWVRWK